VSAELLWEPPASRKETSQLGRWCSKHGFSSYDDAWDWSVGTSTAPEFWWDVAELAGVSWHTEPIGSLEPDESRVPGWRWFPAGRLNYAERMLAPPPTGPSSVAVVALSQSRPPVELSWGELANLVAGARGGLLEAGVQPGQVVAAYLPNVPEAMALMLACASLGAVWACCAPEMGVAGVLDRFSQLAPVVLVSTDGYRYGSRVVSRRDEAEALRSALPGLRSCVWLGYLAPEQAAPPGWVPWEDFLAERGALEYAPVSFDHPLYVLFSSGTTGKPKAIVHGHGGILLEHAKALRLHFDIGPGDRFCWFTTTGWMMWNFCVSALLAGAAAVLFDGDPSWPVPEALWEAFASTGTTCGGVGASYLVACMKAGLEPHELGLERLRALGSTGSPLPAQAARWVYRCVKDDLMLGSFSGGTDVCTGFVGPSPLHPVWAGEISCRCLGAKVEVFDDVGRPVVGQEGELVLTGPLPSMPVCFWGDDGSRYRAAYFERYPGVWAHGDRAVITERRSVVISGRSDGTLKRAGVRIGTAELYSVVESLPEVSDSLAVHIEDPEGGPGEIWLFVVPVEPAGGSGASKQRGSAQSGDAQLDSVPERVRAAVRELSPRYVPDQVVLVPAVPRTLSGKKLEVPIKRLLSGAAGDEVLTPSSVANPESLAFFTSLAKSLALARERGPSAPLRESSTL
jgi:acetoacetyl-CoA synthetase